MTDRSNLYSLEQLEVISAGDEKFITKMVNMFVEMVPESIDSMVGALANQEYKTLGEAAHKLKPTIDMMGIISLKETIRAIERKGKQAEDVEAIPDLLESVVLTLNQVIEELKKR